MKILKSEKSKFYQKIDKNVYKFLSLFVIGLEFIHRNTVEEKLSYSDITEFNRSKLLEDLLTLIG